MNTVNNGIFSKWLIHGYPEYCIGSDKELYRLPYKSKSGFRELRRIIPQENGTRYKIGNQWRSKKYFKPRIYLNPKPELIVKPQKDCPF